MPLFDVTDDEAQEIIRAVAALYAQRIPLIAKISGQWAQQQQGKPSVDGSKEKRDGRIRTERHDRHGDADTQ